MHIKALILSFIRLKILKFSAARLYLEVLFLSIYRLKISKFSAARLYIFSTLYPMDEISTFTRDNTQLELCSEKSVAENVR